MGDFGAWERDLDQGRAKKEAKVTAPTEGETMIKAVQPGTARWKELVKTGIIVDGQRNWYLGDAALEIAPIGDDEAHNGRNENLARYAEEIGVNVGSVQAYRKVSAAWPPGNRVPGTAWKVHQLLMAPGYQEKIRKNMPVSQANVVLGRSNAGRGLNNPTAPPTPEAVRREREVNEDTDRAIRRDIHTEDKQDVTDAVAKRHGITPAQAAKSCAGEIHDLMPWAQEQALKHDSSVAEEAQAAIEEQERGRRTRKTQAERKNANKDGRWIEMEYQLTRARVALKAASKLAVEVDWDDEHREFLTDDLSKTRDLVGLMEMAITGSSKNDLDGEWEKFNEENGGS
jgi:hypothetical protein